MRRPSQFVGTSTSHWIGSLGVALLALGIPFVGCTGMHQTSSQPPVAKSGSPQKLYIAKCAKCHKFYDPTAYSDEEWRTWMHKMSKKAKLSAEQELSLSSYIEATYRGGSKTNAPGAESQQ